MTDQSELPSDATIKAVLAIIAPDHTGFSIDPLVGSYSNFTNLVKIDFADQPAQKIVVRRYNIDNGHVVDKTRREYRALELLQYHDIPVPKPLLMDDDGSVLGSPGIVTEFVTGKQIEPPASAPEWGRKAEATAKMLAKIHAVKFDEALKPYLMDDNVEIAWFIKSGEIPDYMRADPNGEMVWHLVHDLMSEQAPTGTTFLHTDYWSGNILWDNDQISAVVDWEEAAYGEPAIDVAYCRMEYYLEGLPDAAETFLRVYEAETGQPAVNLGLWELAASVRPMISPSGWFTRPHMEERFRRFIASAKERVLS